MNKSLQVYAALVAAMVFWSVSFIWTKSLLQVIEPITLITARLVISTIFLYVLARGNRTYKVFQKKDRRMILFLALFNPFLYFIGENYAMQYVSPTIAAVMIATIPLFTPVVAFIFLKERLKLFNYIGILVSVFGVVMVIIKPDFTIDAEPIGIAFLLLAVLAAVVYSLIIKNMVGRYNALNLTIYQNALGVLYFIPLLFALETSALPHIELSTELIFPLLGLSVLCSSLAFVFFAYGIQHIGASRANVFSNVIPIFTAFFSFIYFGDVLTFYQVGGIVFVILGLFLSQVSSKK